MSNYKTHVSFNTFLALPIASLAIYYFISPPSPLLITFMATFFYSTFFMNPDLDLVHQIKLFSIRGILTLPFRMYSKIFTHRGISHSFFFGTLTRLLWLLGIATLISYFVYRTLPSEKTFFYYYDDYKYFIFYGLSGVVLADWCHLLLDYRKKIS